MGVLGRVCRHCKLDEGMRTWEARLFQLSTKALAAGAQVRRGCTSWALLLTPLLSAMSQLVANITFQP
jgi:hypothetical protein